MMAIANLQYAWTLFTIPLSESLGAKLSQVSVAFSVFVVAQTWLGPFYGTLIDRLGTRVMVSFGAILVGLSWIGSGYATSLPALYVLVWDRRRRSRGGVPRVDRNRGQMVPRSPRARRGAHRGRLRFRHYAHHTAHPVDDRVERIPKHVHPLGRDSGCGGSGGGAVPAEGPDRLQSRAGRRQVLESRPEHPRLHARVRWCAPERSGSCT